jgi:small subunit ribosomal protein S1
MNFGAFVELEPGVEGLIPIGEMSFSKRLNHPSEVVNEGDSVQAVILSVDADRRRISLSLKRLGEDPWTTVEQRYTAEDTVTGLVTRIADFGAFVQLEEGVEGLVHISELSEQRVDRVSSVVKEGQVVQVFVQSVDVEQRRISLSIKAVARAVAAAAPPEDEAATPQSPASKPRKRKRPLRGGLG